MSNTIVDELTPAEKAIEEATNDLRADNFAGASLPERTASTEKPKPFVKTPIKNDNPVEQPLSPEQIIAISQLFQQKAAETIRNAAFDPNAEVQMLSKNKVVITDFSKLTMDDVYDMSVPIEAKPFMSADSLAIKLKDTNYVARWVNRQAQNLGNKMAKGFTYIVPEDLLDDSSIKTSLDAENHYTIDDVVAMKIDKATYFRALRAAHERALATTDTNNSRRRAAEQAQAFMNRESGFGADYQSAQASGRMGFYNPEIEI